MRKMGKAVESLVGAVAATAILSGCSGEDWGATRREGAALSASGVPPAEPVVQSSPRVFDSLGHEVSASLDAVIKDNSDAAQSLNLVARVLVGQGELFEVYEPLPGYVLYSEVFVVEGLKAAGLRTERPPVAKQGLREVWTYFAGGGPMPEAVAAVAAREEARSASHGVEPNSGVEGAEVPGAAGGEPRRSSAQVSTNEDVARVRQALSGGWCDTVYPSQWYANCLGWDFVDCLNDWTGGRTASHHDAFDEVTSVCADIGNVQLKVSSDEGFGGQWTVGQGTARVQWHTDWPCLNFWNDCPFVKSEVFDASGDVFHFRFLIEAE